MSPQTGSGVERAEEAVSAMLRGISGVCMAALLVLVCALILLRLGFVSISLEWLDEVIELLFAWMVFLGTAVVWGKREHIVVDLIPQMLAGRRAALILELIACALALAFLGVFTWQGWTFTVQAQSNTSPILTLPRALWYATMPIAGVLMMWTTLKQTRAAWRALTVRGR